MRRDASAEPIKGRRCIERAARQLAQGFVTELRQNGAPLLSLAWADLSRTHSRLETRNLTSSTGDELQPIVRQRAHDTH